jgi:hypothetical protein
MRDAFYDRFIAVQTIFGGFDVLLGHDWHTVSTLTRLKKRRRDSLHFDNPQHRMGKGRIVQRDKPSRKTGGR